MDIPAVVREKARDFKESQEYAKRVHKLLTEMAPGQQLVIEKITRESNRELFIKCVKLYIDESPYQGGIMFNSDFTVVKKYDINM